MKTNDRIVELVRQVKAGNADAFTSLYEESYKYLHTCVINIVKNEDVAQDMLQDAYVEIYKNIGQLKDDEGFLSWAATIANRKCFAYIKKNKDVLVDGKTDDEGNETDYFEAIADDEEFIPENVLDNREKVNIIRGIIDELSDIQRACVIGFYYNEQKQDEIAEELGIPVNTVKSHLNRAKSKIKEAVGETEKKQGIKLYSIAPFMLLLFTKDAEAFGASMTVPAMSAGLNSAIGGSTSAAGAAGEGAKAAGMAVKTKVIIGLVAGAVVVGTIAGITAVKNRNVEGQMPETVQEENSAINPEIDENYAQNEDELAEAEAENNETGAVETKPIVSMTLEEITSLTESGYDRVYGCYGGVMIVRKGDLFGAVDYDMNEIVPCKYVDFQAANLKGYFVMDDGEQRNLFSPEGELITSTSNIIRTMGNCYAIDNGEGSGNPIKYYDYSGNLLGESNMQGENYQEIMGNHDGCVLLKRCDVDYDNNHVLTEVGKLTEDGNITWQVEYDGTAYNEYRSNDPNFNIASTGWYPFPVMLSGLNGGYYICYMGPAIEWGFFLIYDENSNNVAEANLCHMAPDGTYSDDNYYEENTIKGYYYDGCYFYNRGSKMVWICGDRYMLVDVFDSKKPLATYDYIDMAEADLWLVKNGDKYGYINTEGQEIAMFDDASAFIGDYAMIIEDGIAKLIDSNMNVIEELGEAESVAAYGELFGIVRDGDTILYNYAK